MFLLIGTTLACIAIAIGLDILKYLGTRQLGTHVFTLGRDHSIPEFVMYGQTLLAAVLLGVLFRRTGHRAFAFLSVLFSFVVLDDALQYHERLGAVLVHLLDLQHRWGLRGQDLGEILAWGLAGLALLPLLVWSLKGFFGRNGAILVVHGQLFALLVVFAVVADMVHQIASFRSLHILLGWLEDGGEALVIAFIAAFALLQFRAARPPVGVVDPASPAV